MNPEALFERLYRAYGPQRWWPAKSAFELMAGVVLVQNTAWTGASRAVANLEQAGLLAPQAIREAPDETMWEVVRPAGYFRVKTKRLKALCAFLADYDDDPDLLFRMETEKLREALLGVNGIGKESADSILNYGAGRPAFVADAYTKRLFSRLGWVGEKSGYDEWQRIVHDGFPPDAERLAEYHALIVRHAKRHCRVKPVCAGCPVEFCDFPTRFL